MIFSCLIFFSSSSLFLLSSSIFFALFLSSTSFFNLFRISSIFSRRYSFCLGSSGVSDFFFLLSRLLHFFQIFTLISLCSILFLFSSSASIFFFSTSGSRFQLSVIFFCLIFLKVSCCCLLASSSLLALFSCFFFIFLESGSNIQELSCSLRKLAHSLRSSQLWHFLLALSIFSSLSFSNLLVSSICFLKISSQFVVSTSSACP